MLGAIKVENRHILLAYLDKVVGVGPKVRAKCGLLNTNPREFSKHCNPRTCKYLPASKSERARWHARALTQRTHIQMCEREPS